MAIFFFKFVVQFNEAHNFNTNKYYRVFMC